MTFLVTDGVIPSQRGPRLRAAPHHPPGHPLRLPARRRDAGHAAHGRAHDRAHGRRRTPSCDAARDAVLGVLDREEDQFRRTLRTGLGILDTALGELPEGGTRARRGGVPAARHLRLPARGHHRDRRGPRLRGRPRRVRRGDGRAAPAGARGRQAGRRSCRRRRGRRRSRRCSTSTAPPSSPAARRTSRRPPVLAVVPSDDGDEVGIFLDRTPFYAESGGQVGDTGTITTDTRPGRGARHRRTRCPGCTATAPASSRARSSPARRPSPPIDVERRDAIRRNHTGTHLLHWALRRGARRPREAAGLARGARPAALRLQPLRAGHARSRSPRSRTWSTADVLANDPVRHFETTKEAAAELGAIAFFGEKYGDIVRVLEAGPPLDRALRRHPRARAPATSAR